MVLETHFLCFVIYSIASGAWVWSWLSLAETRLAGLERHPTIILPEFTNGREGEFTRLQKRKYGVQPCTGTFTVSIYSLLTQDIWNHHLSHL